MPHHVETSLGTVMVDLHGSKPPHAEIYAKPESLEYEGRRFGLHSRWALDLGKEEATNVEWLAFYSKPGTVLGEEIPLARVDGDTIRYRIVFLGFWAWWREHSAALLQELHQNRLTHYVEPRLEELEREIEQTTQTIVDYAQELARLTGEHDELWHERWDLNAGAVGGQRAERASRFD